MNKLTPLTLAVLGALSLAAPSVLVSLTGIADLKGVRRDGNTLVIGAATTHAEVAKAAAKRVRDRDFWARSGSVRPRLI